MGRRLFGRYFPMTSAGEDLVPAGPVVVAANHFSNLDPVITGFVLDRPIRYLAVDELYGNSRLFDGLIFWLGTIPMSRTRAPVGALRLAIAELESGGTVGLYPEGVRVWRWGEQTPKRGAAWLARRVGVPLVPVAIAGSDEAMGRRNGGIDRCPIHAEVCRPIMPADFDNHPDPLQGMIDLWRERVDEVLRRWYGDS